jgi:integrase
MGRHLKLDPTPVPGGAKASLPVERGSRRRKTHTFTSGSAEAAATNARAWLNDGAAALAAGRSLPDPTLYDRIPDTAESTIGRRTLAAAISATMHRRYEIDQLAQPGRISQLQAKVDNILLPWFDARSANGRSLAVDELTTAMVRAFAQHLAGRDIAIDGGGDGDEEQWASETSLDLDVAAALSNCSIRELVTVAAASGIDLSAEDARVAPATLVGLGVLDARRHPHAYGYARAYAADLLRVLRWAIVDAVSSGDIPRNVALGVSAVEPDDAVRQRPPATEDKRPLRLSEARRVFSHLHLVHLLVALLQRFCGPRISEAYGPRVADLVDHRAFGILRVVEQGGSQFLERDARGRTQVVSRKKRLKTKRSRRVVVVPGHLMPLLRLVIEVFHTDPETGIVDRAARLVPGILVDGEAGAAGYRDALKQAFAAEGLTYETLGFYPSTHWLRASLATDLKNQPELTGQSVKRVLGHQPGDEVSDLVYYLDDPENLAPFKAIADAIDRRIDRELGDLLIPTSLPYFGEDHPIRARLADAREALVDAGWLAAEGDGPDTPCGTARVADELGIAETTARRCMSNGTLPIRVDVVDGTERRTARLEDVRRLRNELDEQTTVADLARELGEDYHVLYRLIHHLELEIPQDELTGKFRLSEAQCRRIRDEHGRIAALHRRAVRVGMAAHALGIGDRRVRHLICAGELDVDPETDMSNYRFVTRCSIEAYQRRRQPLPSPAGDGALTVTEVAALTGLSREGVRALIDAGLLHVDLDGRRSVVTRDAVRDWAAAHRPELLARLAEVR